MLKDVKEIIRSMDVKKDREAAHEKAQKIYNMGPEALNELVEIGKTVSVHEGEIAVRTRLIRGIIFSLALFAKKKLFFKSLLSKNPGAIELLCDFSEQGFNSARDLLYQIGFSNADIMKRILMSLPVVDRRKKDRDISLSEAILEINNLELASPVKKIKNQGYILGNQDKHSHGIFRTGKNNFVYRIRRI